jgi:hypothetical protein
VHSMLPSAELMTPKSLLMYRNRKQEVLLAVSLTNTYLRRRLNAVLLGLLEMCR